MKNSLLLSCSLLLLTGEVPAQNKNPLDSLLAEIPKAKQDTNGVKLLINISYVYRNMKPDSGIYYGEQAYRSAEQLNWKKGMADASK